MPKISLEIQRLCLPLVTTYANYPFIQMTGFKEGKQSTQTAFNWFGCTEQQEITLTETKYCTTRVFAENRSFSAETGCFQTFLSSLCSHSLGPTPNSGQASPGSMTSMATSTLCAPAHPWRSTSLRTRRRERPRRRPPDVWTHRNLLFALVNA